MFLQIHILREMFLGTVSTKHPFPLFLYYRFFYTDMYNFVRKFFFCRNLFREISYVMSHYLYLDHSWDPNGWEVKPSTPTYLYIWFDFGFWIVTAEQKWEVGSKMNQMEKGYRRGSRVPKEYHNIYNRTTYVNHLCIWIRQDCL